MVRMNLVFPCSLLLVGFSTLQCFLQCRGRRHTCAPRIIRVLRTNLTYCMYMKAYAYRYTITLPKNPSVIQSYPHPFHPASLHMRKKLTPINRRIETHRHLPQSDKSLHQQKHPDHRIRKPQEQNRNDHLPAQHLILPHIPHQIHGPEKGVGTPRNDWFDDPVEQPQPRRGAHVRGRGGSRCALR